MIAKRVTLRLYKSHSQFDSPFVEHHVRARVQGTPWQYKASRRYLVGCYQFENTTTKHLMAAETQRESETNSAEGSGKIPQVLEVAINAVMRMRCDAIIRRKSCGHDGRLLAASWQDRSGSAAPSFPTIRFVPTNVGDGLLEFRQ